MPNTIILHTGESATFKKNNEQYKVSCSLFGKHDHHKKPLYYYWEGIGDDEIVITIEGGTPSPYTFIMREKKIDVSIIKGLILHFTLKDRVVSVEVTEL